MKKLHYGIISTAQIADRFISAIQTTEHSDVLAISSRSMEKARAKADEFHIPRAYASEAELLQDPDIEIVYIPLPNDRHTEATLRAIRAGKHVLCEKPFALTLADAEATFHLAAQKKLFLMEAQKSLFLPATAFVKQFIKTKELGELRQIDLNYNFFGRIPQGNWMADAHQGGALFPSASYSIEYLDYLLDAPQTECLAWITRDHLGMIDEASLNLRYRQSLIAHASISVKVQTKDLATFYFDKGMMEIHQHWKARKVTVSLWDLPKEQVYDFPIEHELVYEADHVYEMLRRGRTESTIMCPERTLRCVALVEEIARQL